MSTTVVRAAPDAAGVRRKSFAAGQSWWLQALRYWHLLSLDAPTVATMWMLAFCFGAGARQHVRQACALFMAVWLLYVADRLLDARRVNGLLEARHRFHARHARWFVGAWLCIAAMTAVLLTYVAAPVRSGWLWLCLPLLGYAVAVHRGGGRSVPKEWIVAVMFAAATVLPAVLGTRAGSQHGAALCAEATLFGAICLLNCMAIARWEHAEARGLPRWTAIQFRAACFSVGLAAVMAAAWLQPVPALACGMSAMLLCLLDTVSEKMEAVALRALVDAVLLTPLVLLLLLR